MIRGANCVSVKREKLVSLELRSPASHASIFHVCNSCCTSCLFVTGFVDHRAVVHMKRDGHGFLPLKNLFMGSFFGVSGKIVFLLVFLIEGALTSPRISPRGLYDKRRSQKCRNGGLFSAALHAQCIIN
jgi:hypothetical protein